MYVLYLCRPDMCPDNLYNVIVQCHYHHPDERPNFSKIILLLESSITLNDLSIQI